LRGYQGRTGRELCPDGLMEKLELKRRKFEKGGKGTVCEHK